MSQRCECVYDCDECYCEKKQGKPNRTVLKCGCPGFAAFPVDTAIGTTRTIATLPINTSELEHPCIQLSFTANIYTSALSGYTFQIFKQCSDLLTPTPISGVYEYSRPVGTTETDTFNFTVCDCDCDSCMDDCCTYLVVVIVTIIPALDQYIGGATLSAIITDNGCGC